MDIIQTNFATKIQVYVENELRIYYRMNHDRWFHVVGDIARKEEPELTQKLEEQFQKEVSRKAQENKNKA